MGRQPGSTNSPEHNDRIAAAIRHRYQDDPEYALMLSAKARERWKREYTQEIEEVLAELEAGHLQRRLIIGMRAMARTVEDGQPLEDEQKQLLRGMRDIRKGSVMYNHAPSLHPPLTTGPEGHEHDHAAGDDPGAADGMHRHPHVHEADNDHDTPVHRRSGSERPGKPSGPGQAVSGMYGSEISNKSPAMRAALRRARTEDLDRRRGGSA